MSLLQLKSIHKSFHGVEVLHGVNIEVKPGSVHALMGENGAGKSTLMKIIAGIHRADSGEIFLRGKHVHIGNPHESQKMGIAMIHQELSPVPGMTVAENIFLGREPSKSGLVNYRQLYKQTAELLRELNIQINPRAKLSNLKVADQQLVEIAKAISYQADVIIMDEPTSAITDREVDNLFRIIDDLRNKGKGLVYISHKMDEVFRISDEITILRDGTYIGTWASKQLTRDDLIRNMVGRELTNIYPKAEVSIGNTIFKVNQLNHPGRYHDINFEVRAGEILGVAGLVGAGRTEVMEGIFGVVPAMSGEIEIFGQKIKIRNPKQAIRQGIAFVTEDRKRTGLVLPSSVGFNITIASMNDFLSKGLINFKREKSTIESQISLLRIKTRGGKQIVGSLSGGNQQKVVLAKWLIKQPRLLILDEPTRGIDVGAKAEIYKLMGEFVSAGNAIIMISSEMPELMGMSDRILVFSNKQISGVLKRSDFTQESIMTFAVANL